MLVENEALVSKHYRRHDDRLPRQFAELLVGQFHAADGAGDADDTVAVGGVALLEHRLVRGGGRGFAVFDDCWLSLGRMDKHEPAAADIAGRRMRDGEGECGGHGGVDRVTAILQNRQPGIGRRGRHGDHDTVAGFASHRLAQGGHQREAEYQQTDGKHDTTGHDGSFQGASCYSTLTPHSWAS